MEVFPVVCRVGFLPIHEIVPSLLVCSVQSIACSPAPAHELTHAAVVEKAGLVQFQGVIFINEEIELRLATLLTSVGMYIKHIIGYLKTEIAPHEMFHQGAVNRS